MMQRKLPARFWTKVRVGSIPSSQRPDLGPCWEWIAYRDHNGYGKFWDGTKKAFAHRLAYEMLVGPIPEGLESDHLCRVRHCVNPAHIEPVTSSVNSQRSPLNKGEGNPSAKMKEADIPIIRALRGQLSQRKLAEVYGISQMAVCLIQRGETWSSIGGAA